MRLILILMAKIINKIVTFGVHKIHKWLLKGTHNSQTKPVFGARCPDMIIQFCVPKLQDMNVASLCFQHAAQYNLRNNLITAWDIFGRFWSSELSAQIMRFIVIKESIVYINNYLFLYRGSFHNPPFSYCFETLFRF